MRILSDVLEVAGLVGLAVAAWMVWGLAAGIAVVSAAALLLSWGLDR